MLRRVAVSVTLASALVLLASIAHAATVERARFAVTLTATLSKDWNVARTVEGECDEVTRYLGRWRLTLSSRRRSTVAATAPAGTRRVVRFSPALVTSLAGTARQSGSTAITRRGAGCVASGARRDCAANRRGVRAARTSFVSPRVGRLRFGRLQRASAIRSLAGSCGNEPAEVRAIRPDLNLADGPLDARDVFAPGVQRFFVSGNIERVTTLDGDLDGRVVERVQWTLRFTRIGR